MSKPKIIITGLGHAGSTYLMRIFQTLDVDVGDSESIFDSHFFQGREWVPATELHKEMIKSVSCYWRAPYELMMDPTKMFDPATRNHFKNKINDLDFPEIIKSPNNGWVWFIDLFQPKYVLVTYRNPQGWMDSMLRWNKRHRPFKIESAENMQAAHTRYVGNSISALEYHNIDYSVITYPDSAESAEYLVDRIRPALDVSGHKHITDNEIRDAFKEICKQEAIK